MRKLIVVLLWAAIATTVVAQEQSNAEEDFRRDLISVEDISEENSDLISSEDDSEGEVVEMENLNGPTMHGFILSSSAKKAVKVLLEEMPCGWPERGIPPLAPYRNDEVNLAVKKSFVETLTQMLRLRVDGLDDMKIKKLSVSYINKKVKFHFIFKKIKATSGFNTDTFIDLMNELGLSVRYEGKGDLDFSILNLAIKGSFKFKIPLIFGSAKIYKFNAVVTLGDCKSNITGLAPTTKANRYINDQIEDLILSGINDNQAAISAKIEEAVVPTVNDQLKGKNMWDLIAMMPSGPTEKCIPPPDPWA